MATIVGRNTGIFSRAGGNAGPLEKGDSVALAHIEEIMAESLVADSSYERHTHDITIKAYRLIHITCNQRQVIYSHIFDWLTSRLHFILHNPVPLAFTDTYQK